jgi:Glyoxalase-like domain
VGVRDPGVCRQLPVALDVVAEVVVGDRHDAVGVDVHRRLEGLVGERVARRLVDLHRRRPRQPAVVGVREQDEVVTERVVVMVLPRDVDPSRVRAAAVVHGQVDDHAVRAHQHLVGWVVAADALDAISRRLGLEVSRGARTWPDGTRLSWRLARVARALTTGALPIFIEWGGSADLHPGKAEADHRLVPSGIAWIEVAGNEQALRSWLGDFDFELRFVDGAPGLSAVAIGTGTREIVLR